MSERTPVTAPWPRDGDAVEFRDAFDVWHRGVAVSDAEPTHRDGRKIHDFVVIWVTKDGKFDPMPWPVEDVRHAT